MPPAGLESRHGKAVARCDPDHKNGDCPRAGEENRMRASGNGGLIPPDAPRACPGRDLILRKSGRPDLRWGRAGEGDRS